MRMVAGYMDISTNGGSTWTSNTPPWISQGYGNRYTAMTVFTDNTQYGNPVIISVVGVTTTTGETWTSSDRLGSWQRMVNNLPWNPAGISVFANASASTGYSIVVFGGGLAANNYQVANVSRSMDGGVTWSQVGMLPQPITQFGFTTSQQGVIYFAGRHHSTYTTHAMEAEPLCATRG